MRGPTKIVAASLYTHPGGTELRVYFEPEDGNDVLETRVERFDVEALEARAGGAPGPAARKGLVALEDRGRVKRFCVPVLYLHLTFWAVLAYLTVVVF